MGHFFLQLPARATRDFVATEVPALSSTDGEPGLQTAVSTQASGSEETPPPVGTAVHLEVLCHMGPTGCTAPPYLALAFEPATATVLCCKPLPVTFSTGFDAYEEVFWGFLEAYMQRKASPEVSFHCISPRCQLVSVVGRTLSLWGWPGLGTWSSLVGKTPYPTVPYPGQRRWGGAEAKRKFVYLKPASNF